MTDAYLFLSIVVRHGFFFSGRNEEGYACIIVVCAFHLQTHKNLQKKMTIRNIATPLND